MEKYFINVTKIEPPVGPMWTVWRSDTHEVLAQCYTSAELEREINAAEQRRDAA